MYYKLKEYYGYVIVIIFQKSPVRSLQKGSQSIHNILTVFVKSVYIRVLFPREIQPINWAITLN